MFNRQIFTPLKTKQIFIFEKYIFNKNSKIKSCFLEFGAGSGTVILRNGSENPDPYQNVTNPQHWFDVSHFVTYPFLNRSI